MCKTIAEGGRCNGWLAREINNQKKRILGVSGNDQVSSEKAKKVSEKAQKKINDLITQIQEKDLIEIDENMSLDQFKRDRKRISKAVAVYKEYDPEKYEEATSKVGEMLYGQLDLDKPYSIQYNENSEELKNIVDKINKGELSVEELALCKRSPKFYIDKFDEIIKESPDNPALKLMIENSRVLREAENQFDDINIIHENQIRGNISKVKNFLNHLGIKTGDPIDRISNTEGRGSSEVKDLYKEYTDMIPSHFFSTNEPDYEITLKSNFKGNRANVSSRPTMKVESVPLLERASESIRAKIAQNPKLSNEELKQAITDNPVTTQILHPKLPAYPAFTLDESSVVRNEKGEVESYRVTPLVYQTGRRTPKNENKDLAQWELVETVHLPGYAPTNIYKKKRVSPSISDKEQLTINLSSQTPTETQIHEFTHILERSCPSLLASEKAIHESRISKYKKQHGKAPKQFKQDGGTFHSGLFSEDYMNKSYGRNYEIYSMKAPELLKGKPKKNEEKVSYAFLGSLVLD